MDHGRFPTTSDARFFVKKSTARGLCSHNTGDGKPSRGEMFFFPTSLGGHELHRPENFCYDLGQNPMLRKERR